MQLYLRYTNLLLLVVKQEFLHMYITLESVPETNQY